MQIAVLGSGMVGNAIATKLVQIKHSVMMGSRTAQSGDARKWHEAAGPGASVGTFADAARFGEVIFNCTNGHHAVAALRMAGAENLRGKILIDVANALSPDVPSTLTVCNTDSLGEQIQREFPATRVVKALNTMNCRVMVAPELVPGDHHLFIAGDDRAAKAQVADHLSEWFGWPRANIIDLGDIAGARGAEMFLPLWIRLWSALGHAEFNISIVSAKKRVAAMPTSTNAVSIASGTDAVAGELAAASRSAEKTEKR